VFAAAAALDLGLVLDVAQALLGERWWDRSDPPPLASRGCNGGNPP
jgi:hypothetical protein